MAELLTASQVGEILRVSKWSVYRLAEQRRIPHVRVSAGTLRFRLSDVERFIESHAVEPVGAAS